MPKHRVSLLASIALAASLGAVTQGLAQSSAPPMAGMAHGTTADSPSSKAFQAANDRMMTAMQVPLTGDADRDFAALMIPHHQGAIDMARIELAFGKDAGLLAMAKRIIADQEREIAELQAWLGSRN